MDLSHVKSQTLGFQTLTDAPTPSTSSTNYLKPTSSLIEKKICDLLRRNDKRLDFPGAQPVSLARETGEMPLYSLKKEKRDYLVCEKTDGERQLFYQDRSGVYFIDRKRAVNRATKLSVFANNNNNDGIGLSSSANDGGEKDGEQDDETDENLQKEYDVASYQTFLLDGELVVDSKVNENNSKVNKNPYFLIFDAMVVAGADVTKKPLVERIDAVVKSGITDSVNSNKENCNRIRFVVKDFFELKDLRFVQNVVLKSKNLLRHANDGFIFTPKLDPYLCMSCPRILKWKPPELNTIDFQLKILNIQSDLKSNLNSNLGELNLGLFIMDEKVATRFRTGPGMDISNILATTLLEAADILNTEQEAIRKEPPLKKRKKDKMDKMKSSSVLMSLSEVQNSLENQVWECKYEKSRNGWFLYKWRSDKQFPNAKYTSDMVLKSIVDDLSFEELAENVCD